MMYHTESDSENLSINKLKILIAEDDEASTLFLEAVMEPYASEIIFTKTGSETVLACKQHPDLDLIFMDIKMPEIDGYEATRQIRKFNQTVKIVAQTAYALTGDREKSLEAGCNAYIAKPLKQSAVLETIQDLIKK